ncbi:MAG: hypothetical protein ABSE19_13730 [Candidatus Acidiferrum sp.]
MRQIPIFDTNIFGHVQDGLIPQKDWRCLLRHRPGHGWPLSAVTAVELLAGFQHPQSERFLEQKVQIELACQLSKGRIHEEPRVLFCKEVLRMSFPHPQLPIELISDYLTVVRLAKSMQDILAKRVRVNRLMTKGLGHSGFSGFGPAGIELLVSGPKNSWKEIIENLATDNFPSWREHFQQTGKRLPDELRRDAEVRLNSHTERLKLAASFLQWLNGSTEPTSVEEVAKRLDAVIELTLFVLREFLLREYNLEKHDSDVYDQFQLYYLLLDRFVIVSADSDLTKRTIRSTQKDRILPFEAFLQKLRQGSFH